MVRFACCALWAITCSVVIARRRRVAAGLLWTMLGYLWGFWDVMCLESSMPSTATVYDRCVLYERTSSLMMDGFFLQLLFSLHITLNVHFNLF